MICGINFNKVEQLVLVLYTCSLIQAIFALIYIFGYFSKLIDNNILMFTTMIMSFVNIVWIIYNTLFLIKDVINKHHNNINPI